MNYEYTLKRNLELETKARQHPYLFGPFSYQKINSFLAGTRIIFRDEPLSESDSRLCLSLLDAYASELKVMVRPGTTVCYQGAERAQYVWMDRRHYFYLMDAEALIDQRRAIRFGPEVIVGEHIMARETYEFLKVSPEKQGAAIVAFCEEEYAKALCRIFGIEKLTRIAVRIKFDMTKLKIRTGY